MATAGAERDNKGGLQVMAAVIEAEIAAADRIVAAREEAAALNLEARTKARRIAQRADARIGRMHQQSSDCIRTRRAEMRAEFAREEAELTSPVAAEVLDEAAARLAARLIGKVTR